MWIFGVSGWIFGVSGWMMSNTQDVLMDAFSMPPFPCEGFRNVLHFCCVSPKAGNLALECYYYLYVNSNKAYVGFDVGHDLSKFSCFLILEENICVQIWYCCFVPTNFAVQLGVSCREATVYWGAQKCYYGSSRSPLPVKGYLIFLMSAIFHDSLSTLPSLKVILASISSPLPS